MRRRIMVGTIWWLCCICLVVVVIVVLTLTLLFTSTQLLSSANVLMYFCADARVKFWAGSDSAIGVNDQSKPVSPITKTSWAN